MKNLFYILLCNTLLSSVLYCSCDIHTSNNGDLDGYWCLTQVDSLTNGKSVEYQEQRVFWSIAVGLVSVRQIPTGEHEEYICHFEHEGNTLRLGDMYLSDRVIGDRLITPDSLFALRPLGINALREEFQVQELKGSNMTLTSPILRLHFERY